MDIGGQQNYEYDNLMNYFIKYHFSHLDFMLINYFFIKGVPLEAVFIKYIASDNLTTY